MTRLLPWCLLAAPGLAAALPQVLDDFSDASSWQATASDQVQASVVAGPTGGLCLRYDFGRVSGYAVLRRELPLTLPRHYSLGLRLRGSGAANSFQFKLVDASGDNVWWVNRPNYRAPAAATNLLFRQRHVEFAWGPTADRELKQAAAVELVVASGEGGAGELCFERLSLNVLPAPRPLPPPRASASTSASGAAPAAAIDGRIDTAWRSARDGTQHWQLDFGAPRELAGVMLRFGEDAPASDFDLQVSDDGRRWRTVRQVRGATRNPLALWWPEGDAGLEARHLRVQLQRGPKPQYALAELQAMGPQQWPTANDALKALAAASPRGRFPRGFVGEQNYWTLVGVDGGGASAALISEDGAIEPRKGGPSLEPFVIDGSGAVTSFADVRIEHRLRDGYLPLPEVVWHGKPFRLAIEAGADGDRDRDRDRDRAQLIVRYTLTNTTEQAQTLTLALALRPWQVNPPQQFLNTPGGVSPVRQIAWDGQTLRVDGRSWLRALSPPGALGVAAFDGGDPLQWPASATPLTEARIDDPHAMATAVLRWPFALAAGESRSIALLLPLGGAAGTDPVDAPARLDAIAQAWQGRLNRVTMNLPPAAQPLLDTLRSSLAHMLISRDGPALQPGTRSYARSWIRDGAMMVAGLLRLGEVEPAREFVQWYGSHLFSNGKVPCCVDARGADPVAENDSHGQYIYAVAELWRHTGDRAWVERWWPQVDAAARYMEQLRQSTRRGEVNEFFGLMPASISHEGYSAKPMHSYWDDFWALAGYRDAVRLAQVLGHRERAAELAAQRDQFGAELAASLARSVARHRIDHLPGAAELGDYDPSSSTLIFSPAGAEASVPRALLEATWERYWHDSVARRDQRRPWADYTPYELRSVSALTRLGHLERAHAMLDFFLNDRRPLGWNQWAEVVGREYRQPRFVGDMPHAWISSDYIRSVLDLLAYERDADQALVLAAGVPQSWWRDAAVRVQGLRTAYGRLDYELQREGADVLRLKLAGGLEPPPGGLWLSWPEGTPPARTADGELLHWQQGLLRLPQGALDLRLRLEPGGR